MTRLTARETIQHIMKRAHVTSAHVAVRAGVTPQTIQAFIEKDKPLERMKISYLLALAKEVKLPPTYLLSLIVDDLVDKELKEWDSEEG